LFKHNDNKGYSPNNKNWPTNVTTESKNGNIDIESFTSLNKISCELFEEFLAECNSDRIILFLVYPPIYANDSKTIKNINYYNQVAKKYNAIFLDYSKDSSLVFNNFYNSQHLSTKGATIFTSKLAKDIKAQTQNKVSEK
jgi:hypothetical protein